MRQTLNEDTVKAYVEYANDPDAPERAIKGLDGVEFRGEKLQVEYLSDAKYRRRKEMKGYGEPRDGYNDGKYDDKGYYNDRKYEDR